MWGEVTNGAGNCPYRIALQLNRSADPQLELGVAYTQSSTPPFADYFMFAITGTLPRLPRATLHYRQAEPLRVRGVSCSDPAGIDRAGHG